LKNHFWLSHLEYENSKRLVPPNNHKNGGKEIKKREAAV
jgi:hypothetical protein